MTTIKFYGMKNNVVEYQEIEKTTEGFNTLFELKEKCDKAYFVDGFVHNVVDKSKNIDCRLEDDNDQHESIYIEIMARHAGYNIYDEFEGFINEYGMAFDNR